LIKAKRSFSISGLFFRWAAVLLLVDGFDLVEDLSRNGSAPVAHGESFAHSYL
jgi:hypothetical protein